MTKFQKCILVCFMELLVLLVCLTGVIEFASGRKLGMATLALVSLVVSLIFVIIFASQKPKDKDKAPDEKV